MYLGAALKLAVPWAVLDREDMARAYGYEGPEAAEAKKSCVDLKAMQGLKPGKFNAEQREIARLALLWAEQYLFGYMNAIKDFDKTEFAVSRKHWRRIRQVRMEHFGKTKGEAMCQCAELVDVFDLLQRTA